MFIVFEGIDGCGKTSQVLLVAQELQKIVSKRTYCTKEPSDGPIGRFIRDMLKINNEIVNNNTSMCLLFAADRADHLKREVIPALMDENIVLCDRYYMSSFAYQTHDCKLSSEYIYSINDCMLQPNMTIIIDIDVETAIRRLSKRQSVDYTENKSFLTHARRQYTAMYYGGNIPNMVLVDGSLPVSEVAKIIVNAIVAKCNLTV